MRRRPAVTLTPGERGEGRDARRVHGDTAREHRRGRSRRSGAGRRHICTLRVADVGTRPRRAPSRHRVPVSHRALRPTCDASGSSTPTTSSPRPRPWSTAPCTSATGPAASTRSMPATVSSAGLAGPSRTATCTPGRSSRRRRSHAWQGRRTVYFGGGQDALRAAARPTEACAGSTSCAPNGGRIDPTEIESSPASSTAW